MRERFDTRIDIQASKIPVAIDGEVIDLTDEDLYAIVRDKPDHPLSVALRAKFDAEEVAKVDFFALLNADQRRLAEELGLLTAEAWLPTELVTRWKGRKELSAPRAAAELEVSLLAQRFVEASHG